MSKSTAGDFSSTLSSHPALSPALNPLDHTYTRLLCCRRALHTRLGLPSDRPLLRLNNAVDPRLVTEPPQGLPGGKATWLQNVHMGIPPPPISGGTLHMIEGSYDYHHYMQVCLAAVFGRRLRM